jgi:hypothetical protein
MALPEPKKIEPASLVAPALRDSRQRWWLLVLLFSAMLISYAHRSALSVAAPFISRISVQGRMGVLLHVLSGCTPSCRCPPVVVDRRCPPRVLTGFVSGRWLRPDRFGVGMASAGLAHAPPGRQSLSGFIALAPIGFPVMRHGHRVYLTGVRKGAAWLAGSARTFWPVTVGSFSSC